MMDSHLHHPDRRVPEPPKITLQMVGSPLHEPPRGVDPQGTCAPVDMVAPVNPHLEALRRRLNTLGIEAARRRLGLAALPASFQRAPFGEDSVPDARWSPPSQIAIDRVPLANVARAPTPRAAGLGEGQHPMDHGSPLTGRPPAPPRDPLAWASKGVESCPWIIGHLCGIVPLGAHR